MITENQIDKSTEWVSAETETATKNFIENFPEILTYLFSGQFDLLTAEENELLIFIFLVVNNCLNEDQISSFDLKHFHQNEEKNWDLFENNKNLSWEEKLNKSFENYHQEDALALVEDLLVDDEETPLTTIGKEFIFVTTKSFIDCFK